MRQLGQQGAVRQAIASRDRAKTRRQGMGSKRRWPGHASCPLCV